MVKGRDGVLTQAVWSSTLLLTIKMYFFLCLLLWFLSTRTFESYCSTDQKMQHSESGQRAEWKWGGEGRKKRDAPTGAGASLVLAWSLSDGRSRVNTGDASVSFQFWASCFGLPILNSAWKLALPRWVWTLEWVYRVEMGGCSQALLLKKPKHYLSSRALRGPDSTALGAKQLLLSWLFANCIHTSSLFPPNES